MPLCMARMYKKIKVIKTHMCCTYTEVAQKTIANFFHVFFFIPKKIIFSQSDDDDECI